MVILAQNLALSNKNNGVLLSQALCVIGSLGNVMFKQHNTIEVFVVNNKFSRATYYTIHSTFDRKTLLFKWGLHALTIDQFQSQKIESLLSYYLSYCHPTFLTDLKGGCSQQNVGLDGMRMTLFSMQPNATQLL